MIRYEQVIGAALDGVREELGRHRAGSGTVSTAEQLEHFEQTLQGMLEDVRQGTFNPSHTGMAHTVVDSWPLGHPLADHVLAAVETYEASRRKTGHH